MKSRLLVAAVGIPVLIGMIFFAPVWVMAVALAILSGIGALELGKCVGAPQVVKCIAALGAVYMLLMGMWKQHFSMELVLLILVIALFLYAVIKAGEVKFAHIGAALFGMFAIPYAFGAFLRIYETGYPRA